MLRGTSGEQREQQCDLCDVKCAERYNDGSQKVVGSIPPKQNRSGQANRQFVINKQKTGGVNAPAPRPQPRLLARFHYFFQSVFGFWSVCLNGNKGSRLFTRRHR